MSTDPNPNMVRLTTELPLTDLTNIIARKLDDQGALAFLQDLDDKMVSWDFTLQAAEFFNRSARELINDTNATSDQAVVLRVAEFVRQAQLIPGIGETQRVMTVWTDPNAQMSSLDIGDLAQLVELATVAATVFAITKKEEN